VVVVYANLRSGNPFFAAHAATLGCVFAMIAWCGEPARGTRRANVLWGLLVLCGIFLGAAFVTWRASLPGRWMGCGSSMCANP
jgi:hypothetical protein